MDRVDGKLAGVRPTGQGEGASRLPHLLDTCEFLENKKPTAGSLPNKASEVKFSPLSRQ